MFCFFFLHRRCRRENQEWRNVLSFHLSTRHCSPRTQFTNLKRTNNSTVSCQQHVIQQRNMIRRLCLDCPQKNKRTCSHKSENAGRMESLMIFISKSKHRCVAFHIRLLLYCCCCSFVIVILWIIAEETYFCQYMPFSSWLRWIAVAGQ